MNPILFFGGEIASCVNIGLLVVSFVGMAWYAIKKEDR